MKTNMRPAARTRTALKLLGLGAMVTAAMFARGAMTPDDVLPPALHQVLSRTAPAPSVALQDGQRLTWSGASILLQAAGSTAAPDRIALPQARRWGSVTLLPNGRVLLWGGVDAEERLAHSGWWFDPATRAVTPASDVPLMPRAGHTLTVLSDGRVLAAGGWSGHAGAMPEAEIWDPRTRSVHLAKGTVQPPLTGHASTVMGSGLVLLANGSDPSGKPFTSPMVFDPAPVREAFATGAGAANLVVRDTLSPRVADSIPRANVSDAAVDGMISVRFSEPMDVRSIKAMSVTLMGPGGAVDERVVATEQGRLLFATPTRDLFTGSHYTLFLQGLRSARGVPLPFTTIDFTTISKSGGTPGIVLPRPAPAPAAVSSASVPSVTTTLADEHDPLVVSTGSDPLLNPLGLDPCWQQSHGQSGPCRKTSSMFDGVWYPGRDAVGTVERGRWRVNKPDITPQEVAAAALYERLAPRKGVTGVEGRLELVDGQPIANVDVSIGDVHTRTDGHGDFELKGAPSGRQWMYVDGSTANRPGYEYGQFVVGVNLTSGRIRPLEYRMYLPRILNWDKVLIPSPTVRDMVITHPELPGLEIHIPAGTVIKDYKGHIVRELSIVPTPVDRAPIPTPLNFPVYFSIEPAGATVQNLRADGPQGLRIVYPNDSGAKPRTELSFYSYHPAEGWKAYGKGDVTADGRHIVPRRGVGFSWVMGSSLATNNQHYPDPKPTCPCGAQGGDPVDIWSDLLTERQTDLVIDDIFPITLSRFYEDDAYGATHLIDPSMFGGWRSNFDMYLYSAHPFPDLGLRLPDGNLIEFSQVTPTGEAQYQWSYGGMPNAYTGMIAQAGIMGACKSNFECFLVTLKDGTQYEYPNYATTGPNRIRDRFGNQLVLTYSGGILQQVTSPSGRYITFTYNTDNTVHQAKDHTGRTWTYTYQTVGAGTSYPVSVPTRVTYPDQTYYSYTYNSDPGHPELGLGTLSDIVDRNGVPVMHTNYQIYFGDIDTASVTNQTFADGTMMTFSQSYAGPNSTVGRDVTLPNGHVTKVYMDPTTGYPKSIVEASDTALARTTTYTRDGNGFVQFVTDPLGRTTGFGYDGFGDVMSMTQLYGTSGAVAQSAQYTPDFHQLQSYTDGLGHTTTFGYTNGCLTSVTDALTHTSNILCNPYGQTVSVSDALGHGSTFGYRVYDPATVTDALGRTTSVTTDILGRVIAVKDPLGNLSRMTYDINDRPATQVDPMSNTTTLHFDAMGRPQSVTLPNMGTVNYYYDTAGRFHQRKDALLQSEFVNYDGSGRVQNTIDRKGQITQYVYDALDRVNQVTMNDSSTIVPGYDAADRVTSLADSVNGTLGFQWDDLDNLHQQTSPQGTVTYTYDVANRRATMNAGSQAQVTYTFDNANRLSTIVQGSETVQLGYDDANRRNSVTLPNGVATAIGYDNANQVKTMTSTHSGIAVADLSYNYDNVGRRISQAGSLVSDLLATATTATSIFDSNNRQTSFNAATLTYDANGNMTGDGTRTYTWNVRNQLTQVTQGGSTIAAYTYDALGHRASKAINGGTATSFLYDGANAVQETQGATVTPLLTGLGVDERFARTESTGRMYYLTDALGSTVGLTNTSGALVQTYQYEPYGEVSGTGSSTNPYQYTGRENDGNGLYFYRARYYSPGMKRFIGEDPTKMDGGINTYAYAIGNPINYSDPLGLNVTMTCRPLRGFDSEPKHCSVFVWNWVKDKCGGMQKVIRKQYSLPYDGTVPSATPPTDRTYQDDRNAFNNPGGVVENNDIGPPDGMSQQQFDNNVIKAGEQYSQGPYHLLGPNSNTAAATIIYQGGHAGVIIPDVPGAVAEYYYIAPPWPTGR